MGLAKAVREFDASLLVLVWRCVGKMVVRVKPCLSEEGWSPHPLMVELCLALQDKGRECVGASPSPVAEVTPSGVFNKLLRTCWFLVTLLVKLVQVSGHTSFITSTIDFMFSIGIFRQLS